MTTQLDLVDYHIHTARCGHASGEMQQYVEQAVQAGLPEMGFSDHIFMYWLPPDARDPELAMPEEDFDTYVEDVFRLRRAHPEIEIKLAVEADYIPTHQEALAEILARYPWDYVLGSVHFIDDWGMDDSRYVDRFNEWDIDELYERYFGLILRAADSGLFDTIAHLDVIKKFGHRPRKEVAGLYERVARGLAAAGVAVEVNTAGLRKPCQELYPQIDLLTACQKAGVPATLGSDAHAPEQVAADLPLAVEHLRAAGYDRIIAYRGRHRDWKSI
ncbi:MAG: histidinol-phosphatase HisJ family protein [Chloroflexi bacterium]|nr:histidinol-phosphatase HisJ family protein [Chloroflexota bacterium]